MKHPLIALLLTCLLTSTAFADDPAVKMTKRKQSVTVTIGDEAFTAYQFGKQWNKPFLLPVVAGQGYEWLAENRGRKPGKNDEPGTRVMVVREQAPVRVFDKVTERLALNEVISVDEERDGWLRVPDKQGWVRKSDVAPLASMVTRRVDLDPPKIKDRKSPFYYDHPHHKGVWLSIDEVNGIEFWNEDGKIKNVDVKLVTPTGNPAVMKVTNHWLGEEGQPLVEETSTISIYSDRMVIYDILFKAVDQEVTFGDTKEGLFAIRLPNSMREMMGKAEVVNAEGTKGTSKLWGRTTPWIDYAGDVGGHMLGVALFDHPDNFRPSRYHVRDYGLFAINPFGEAAYTKGSDDPQSASPRTLKPGETLHLLYGLYVHQGGASEGKVADAYARFVKRSKE